MLSSLNSLPVLGSNHSTTSGDVIDKRSKTMCRTRRSRGSICKGGHWRVTATKVAFVCCLQHHLKYMRSVQDFDILSVVQVEWSDASSDAHSFSV